MVDAVSAALGAQRVGVRLSPWNGFNDMSDSDGWALWDYVAAELDIKCLDVELTQGAEPFRVFDRFFVVGDTHASLLK